MQNKIIKFLTIYGSVRISPAKEEEELSTCADYNLDGLRNFKFDIESEDIERSLHDVIDIRVAS